MECGQVEILFNIFNRVPGTHLNIYSVHTQTCFGCGAGADKQISDLKSQSNLRDVVCCLFKIKFQVVVVHCSYVVYIMYVVCMYVLGYVCTFMYM